MGIDIFGRNTYGGGCFDTYKAIEVIKNYGLNIGLFAPAWTYECCDNFNYNETYRSREQRFWMGIIPQTTLDYNSFKNDGSESISAYIKDNKISSFELPFVTNFDIVYYIFIYLYIQGYGNYTNFNGDVFSTNVYSNLSLQSVQPSHIYQYIHNDKKLYLSYDNEISFDSGNSIKINGYYNKDLNGMIVYPLYNVKWLCNKKIEFSYVVNTRIMYL